MRDVAPSLLFCLMLGAAGVYTSPASAEDIYSTLERSGSSTVKDHVRRAQRARDGGRWTEAHAAYDAALQATDPASNTEKERAEIAGELGLCELELRKYRDAAEHLAWSLEQRNVLPLELQLRFEAGLLIWSAYTEDELHDRATALRGVDEDASRCARPNAPRACSELRDLQEKRDLLTKAGWVTVVSGGAIGALTLVSLLVDRTSSSSDGVRVVPTVSGQRMGLMMAGVW
ncbi:hypothetical protein [Sorangium sp. So ce204]|uniref:hypothetical protein n=1 Tax=Sorangium sp. So ce204 TaxID=3133288 RepID=UPI003F5DBB87